MARYTYAQQVCIKKAGLALHGALWPGCRIGVAISGGVDSFTLLQTLLIRKAILPFATDILAIHINPGFCGDDHGSLAPWLARAGAAAHIETADFGPRAHSPENRKNSPCFYCAWLRRKRFFELCRQYRLTHLALGHNAEDLEATFFMNLLRNARVMGMGLNESFFQGRLRLVRPLLLVEKKYIRQAARQWHLPVWQNACPSAGKTARGQMEEAIARLCDAVPGARRSLLAGLCRWQLGQSGIGTDAQPED